MGDSLLVAYSKQLILWNSTGDILWHSDASPKNKTNYFSKINKVDFSSNGQLIAVSYKANPLSSIDDSIQIIDIHNDFNSYFLHAKEWQLNDMIISTNHLFLSYEKKWQIYTLKAAEPLEEPITYTGDTRCFAIDKSGQFLFRGFDLDRGHGVEIRDLKNNTSIQKHVRHQVRSIEVSPDGNRFMVEYHDKSLDFFERSGKSIYYFSAIENTKNIAISPDWKFFMVQVDTKIALFPLTFDTYHNSFTPLLHLPGHLTNVAFTPDGQTKVFLKVKLDTVGLGDFSYDEHIGKDYSNQIDFQFVWKDFQDTKDLSLYYEEVGFFAQNAVTSHTLAISQDHYERSDDECVPCKKDGSSVSLLDNITKTEIQTIRHANVSAVAFSPDGQYILTSNDDIDTDAGTDADADADAQAWTYIYKMPALRLKEDIATYSIEEMKQHGLKTFD